MKLAAGLTVVTIVVLVLLALVIGILSLLVLIKFKRRRRQKRGFRRPPKVLLTAHNKLYSQVSIMSPGADMEFPRENLKLLEELGEIIFDHAMIVYIGCNILFVCVFIMPFFAVPLFIVDIYCCCLLFFFNQCYCGSFIIILCLSRERKVWQSPKSTCSWHCA